MCDVIFRWLWSVVSNVGFWTAAATVVIAVATIYYTRYAKRQWDEMRNANDAAKQSAEAAVKAANIAEQTLKDAQRQFSISHRPWCAFAGLPKTESALGFDGEGGHLNISYTVRNGSSTAPAIGVITVQKLVVSDSEVPNLLTVKRELEQLVPPVFMENINKAGGGVFLLPEASYDVPPSRVAVQKQALDLLKGKRVALFLLLCVPYRDEFGTTVHKTGATYRFVTEGNERSFQPIGEVKGHFEMFGVGYAD